MKTHFWKKAAALALVLSLFVSLLSVAAMAEDLDPENPGTEITQTQENDSESPAITQKEDSEEAPDETQDSGTEEDPAPDVSLLSGDAAAEEVDTNDEEQPTEGSQPEVQSEPSDCTNGGAHTPDLTQELPLTVYTSCGGGYKEPGYPCTVCGVTVTKDGANASWVDGTGVHTPGTEKHAANYSSCDGGFQTEWYICTVCNYAVNADGSLAERTEGTGVHTPGEKSSAPNTVCGGGYGEEAYICTICGLPTDADGNALSYRPGTEAHTPGSEKHAPTYTSCSGGYETEWYYCTVCGEIVNADGSRARRTEGTGVHTPGKKHAANYVPCRGGVEADYYECTDCLCPVDADGKEAKWTEGNGIHTPGKKHAADYTECGGGIKTEWYECTVCHIAVKEDGSYAEGFPGSGAHTPGGQKYNPNYTVCGGGYETEWYYCTVCNRSVKADGSAATYVQGNGTHTPGTEKHAPFYTSCNGGRTTEFYTCINCGYAVNADGSEAEWIDGNDEHQIFRAPATAPTYETAGWLAHWECSVCGLYFADSEGQEYIRENVWLPPLTRDTAVTSEVLASVPETVSGKYTTVEAVHTALLDTAKTAGFDAGQTNAGSVLLDVKLQIKNADGTLTPVSAEDFPADGVTVVLPYPAGTDKNYTFVITHMITHGPGAGQIEVLPSVNSEDGICVHFTSMSPVCISYMLQPVASAPATPAPAAPVVSSTVPKTSDANHGAPWGMLALLSIGGLGALSIAGKKLRSF